MFSKLYHPMMEIALSSVEDWCDSLLENMLDKPEMYFLTFWDARVFSAVSMWLLLCSRHLHATIRALV